MNLRKILFVGGDSLGDAAVKVRAMDIATRLGCDFMPAITQATQIPDQYAAFVCVRPDLPLEELGKLARRGTVIWDIVDVMPPREHVALYLTSTALAKKLFANYGRMELIPHHHCNFSGTPNPPTLRRPVWLGTAAWLPRLRGFAHDAYFVRQMNREDVVQIYRQTGIGLNLRGISGLGYYTGTTGQFVSHTKDRSRVRTIFDMHLVLTSGIKLINCIGFGIPSLSSEEPAYHEMGENCTIFSNIKDSAKWVRALQNDDDLYMDLRKKCLRKAAKFHINTIVQQYKTLLESL